MPVDLAAPDVSAVLDASRSLRVAVASKKGPHVTPELFVVLDGRLWSFTAASSLKVRVARGRSRVGLAIGGDDRDTDTDTDGRLVLGADVTVLDPARPISALTSGFAIGIPRVVAAFASRHAFEVAGGTVDVALGRFGLVPGRWVLLAFEVDAIAVLRGGALMRADGWSTGTSDDGADAHANDDDASGDGEGLATDVPLDAIPAPVRHLLDRGVATLGWNGSCGPLALPVAWDRATSTATVDAGLFAAVGAAERGPAALTFDEWIAPGPAGKRGVMLRGDARASTSDGVVSVRIEVDRAVAWDGTDTSSTSGIRDDPSQTDQTATDSAPNKETRAG